MDPAWGLIKGDGLAKKQTQIFSAIRFDANSQMNTDCGAPCNS